MDNTTNNEELYADLFAYRFALLDIYEDNETEIIKKLKINLVNIGYEPSIINNLLLSFYNFYLIPITEEEIINANVYIYIPPSIQNRNLINLILNAINSSNLLNNEEENEEEQEKLTEEEFNNLPLLKINDSIDKECAICIDKFEKDMEVIKLDCNHLFHKNCIKSYFLNYNNKCPMCRYQIN
jgi:hypothetical protein